MDFFVIGGGSGGVRAARIAAGHGASVMIAEESRYGGTCVIRGCIPKKFFVYASEFSHKIEDAPGYGWTLEGKFDWELLRTNKDVQIDRLNGIYINMLKKAGVTVLDGKASIRSAHEIEVNGSIYHAKTILIATGGRPVPPSIPGGEHAITSNEAFDLKKLPKRMTIVGAGYIGLEFSSIFQGMGVEVTLVHHRKEALRGFDEDIRHEVTSNLRKNGVNLLFETSIERIEPSEQGNGLRYQCSAGDWHETDAVMYSIGRRPNTDTLGLDEVGIQTGERGGVLIDDYGQTNIDNIYAVGDCTDRLQLTPVAVREGHSVADNLFADLPERRPLHHATVPTAIFSQPPAATVGQSEAQAREDGEVLIYRSHFRPLYHTMTTRDEKVMMKLVVDKASRRVLGLHMVGEGAADIVQIAAIAIGMGATKADFDRTVALHPSTSEEFVLMREPV